MRSIGKYDLLEAIAGGDVAVFLAEEIRTRLRRLVCIIGWKDDPKPPSTRDILQAFRRLAPDPPGVIIDSGQDAASRSVYLVTSYPSDPLAIETWVKAYDAFTERRTGATPKGSDDLTQGFVSEQPAKAGPIPPKQPKREPAPPPVAEKPVGEFTRMFHDNGPQPVPVADERSPLVPDLTPNEKPSQPGSFTREFFASAPPPPEPSPQRDQRSKTGEFTKFFRGGFNSPPAQPPVESDSFPAPSPGKREGEFTRMFNSPSQPTPEPQRPEPSFTPVFDRGVMPQDAGAFSSPVRQDPPRPRTPDPAPSDRGGFMAPKFDATNIDRGHAPAQNSAPPSAGLRPMWGNEEKGEQSRVFSAPPAEPVVNRPPTPAGPSEFTRIISGGPRNAPPPPPEAPPPVSAPPQAAAIPAFTPPAVVMPPAPAFPQAPAAPQPPAFQMPAAPQMAPPQMAAPPVPAPQAPAPVTKAPSYLPLIIVLNVVLVVGIALVLYFILKPH
jgi:hypothetical protein